MSEFNDGFPSYEHLAIHSEEAGKKIRRKLWNVFWIMLAITLIELYIGFKAEAWHINGTLLIKVLFIGFTILKAAYIVLSFMHLGDEVKVFRYLVLVPFIVFVLYLVALVDLSEGTYSKDNRYVMDKHIIDQQIEVKARHSGGAAHAE